MGTRYSHLTIEERCHMALLQTQGRSVRQIAATLDRSPSTIARELKRNASRRQPCQPAYAQQQAQARRWRGSKLERDPALRQEVMARLQEGCSPEQVSGRLALEQGCPVISHETIYRFVYAQMTRTKNYAWRHFLPKAKSKRGWRGRKGGSPASFIAERRHLSQRPQEAEDRQTPGHWEADLMLFGKGGEVLLTLHERYSRLTLPIRLPSKEAEGVAQAMIQALSAFPPHWRKTVAFDNGTEFARHYRLHSLGIETFFCDVRSPWQKGGVENANGRLRRWLPRKTRLDQWAGDSLLRLGQACNNIPRKCLGYQTPAEIFSRQVLHLKCESTFPRKRE